jgi:hypothetical protein
MSRYNDQPDYDTQVITTVRKIENLFHTIDIEYSVEVNALIALLAIKGMSSEMSAEDYRETITEQLEIMMRSISTIEGSIN